ncbi:MAG: hypothetical protein ACRD2A_00495 [Vicinamibacterales bacterium]
MAHEKHRQSYTAGGAAATTQTDSDPAAQAAKHSVPTQSTQTQTTPSQATPPQTGQTAPSQTPGQTAPYQTSGQTAPGQAQYPDALQLLKVQIQSLLNSGGRLTLDDIVKLLPAQDASQIVAQQVALSLSGGPGLTIADLLKHLSPEELHKLLVTVLIQRPVFEPAPLGIVAEDAVKQYDTVRRALAHD